MTVISEYQFKFSFLGELSLYQKEFWTWKAKIFYHIFFNQLHKSQNTRQLCVSFDVTLCVTQCSVPPHVCLPVTVGAYQSLYICKNWQTGFWICDSPVCSLLYGLKLAIHAVWQTKTGWLSSNSLQTDLPASGCRAKTERCRTEIETVVRGIPIFPRSLFFSPVLLGISILIGWQCRLFFCCPERIYHHADVNWYNYTEPPAPTRNRHGSLPKYFTNFNQRKHFIHSSWRWWRPM